MGGKKFKKIHISNNFKLIIAKQTNNKKTPTKLQTKEMQTKNKLSNKTF